MEQIERTLRPLLESLPEGVRDYGIVIFLLAALAVLLPVAWYQRRLLQVLVVGRRAPTLRFPEPAEEDLSTTPLPAGPPGPRRIMVEGVPARVRLVVLAPLGTVATIDPNSVEELLNHLVWGLGTAAVQDGPRVVVWPPQLSAHGFAAVFHRFTRKPEADGQPSRWVLVGGPTPPRPRPVLVGLGLWTDEPTTIGRISMTPNQWATSLHLQTLEVPAVVEPAPTVRDQVPATVTAGEVREAEGGNNAPVHASPQPPPSPAIPGDVPRP